MNKQIEIKWTEDEKGKECIKVFLDNELIVTQSGLSAVAIAEILSRLDCDVFISSKNHKGEIRRDKFKRMFP